MPDSSHRMAIGRFVSNWRGIVATLATALVLVTAMPVEAADTYKQGDEVEVFFLNKWWPGTVKQTNPRGDVMAEYEFAGRPQEKVFKSAEVRFPYESGAIARGRMWSDASGSFRVKAAALGFEAEKVVLRKEDKTELKVPIERLSKADQDFVKRLRKELGTAAERAPEPPPAEEFDTSSGAQAWASWSLGTGARVAVEPDPWPAYLRLKQGGVAFPNEDFFDRLGAVLPLGGPDSWVLAAIENASPGQSRPTRLVWASLAKQQIGGRQILPPGEVVMDYFPPGRLLLTQNTVKSEGDPWGQVVMGLWKVAPADKSVTPVVRWKGAGAATDLQGGKPWGRIIDNNTVLQRWKKNEFVAWDIPGKRIKYVLPQESFFVPDPAISGGRRYLFVPEDKGVRIIEAATGRLVDTLPAPNGASGVGVTEDGKRLAVLDRNELSVWDLTQPQAERERYQADAIGTPFTSTLEWVTPDRIMADGFAGSKVLFSLSHKIALWNYDFDMNAVPDSPGRRFRQIVDGHLVYAASISRGTDRGLAVGAVKLPGPKVDEVAQAFDPESLLIVKPGISVRFEVKAGNDAARVTQALEGIAQKNGWVVDPSSENTLLAEMKLGEQQTVTYRFFGPGGVESTQSATFTPYISQLTLTIKNQVTWQSASSSGAPPVVRLGVNESAQAEVDKWQRPNVEFFEQVRVPPRIIDPSKKNGLGSTDVTTRGLVAK